MPLSSHIVSAAIDARSGRAFAVADRIDEGKGHYQTMVHVLDIRTGEVLYSLSLGMYGPMAVAVDGTNNRALVVTAGGPSGSVAVLDVRAASAERLLLTAIDIDAAADTITPVDSLGRAVIGCRRYAASLKQVPTRDVRSD